MEDARRRQHLWWILGGGSGEWCHVIVKMVEDVIQRWLWWSVRVRRERIKEIFYFILLNPKPSLSFNKRTKQMDIDYNVIPQVANRSHAPFAHLIEIKLVTFLLSLAIVNLFPPICIQGGTKLLVHVEQKLCSARCFPCTEYFFLTILCICSTFSNNIRFVYKSYVSSMH